MRWAVVVGIAIWLGSDFGRIGVFPETGSAILFLPYAVLAAALLLSPPRRWWIYLVASFIGHMMVDVEHIGRPTLFAASTEVANVIRALIVALAWRRVERSPPRFEAFKGTAIFLTISGLLGPALAAFVGAAVSVWFGRAPQLPNAYARLWAAWYLANAVVGLTVLPFILIAAANVRDWRDRVSFRRWKEVTALSLGLSLAGAVLCGGLDPGLDASIRLYAPLPFLIWAATRFGPGAATGALVVVTASTVTGVMTGWGAFSSRPNEIGVLSVYLFLCFTAIPCVLVSSLMREREVAVREMRERQERYGLATIAGAVGVWDWRLDTHEIFVDPNLKTLLGYADHEVRNHLDDWLRRVHPEDAPRSMEHVRPLLAGGEGSFEAEYRMIHKDGSARWLLTRGRTLREPGQPQRIVGTTTDITGRKVAELARVEAEVALRERQRQLEHLGRVTTLGQLSGALTHELRQPLTAVLTNAHTAKRMLGSTRPDLAAVKDILDDIITADARAGEIIQRLRRLLKGGEPSLEPLELGAVMQDGLAVINADLIERGVEVKREFSAALPPVRGDRVELQQVLINLVLNASDAMSRNSPGDRRVTVGTTSDDGFVVSYVSDCGSGIPAAEIQQVFEPFVTTKPTGLGLGLAICRSIATAHNGRLWATNNPDRGATFHLALPALQGVILNEVRDRHLSRTPDSSLRSE